jgi:hypothetical protein
MLKRKVIYLITPVNKDENGKIKTEERNIYSGINSTGNIKKSYFSYVPSPFHGSPYEDPGRAERKSKLMEKKKWANR